MVETDGTLDSGLAGRAPLGVMKIGGGILRDSADLQRVADLVRRNACRRNVLVVSAFNGVTDALMALSERARTGHFSHQDLDALRQQHVSLFSGSPFEAQATALVAAELDVLGVRLSDAARTREVPARVQAAVACVGERMSCKLVALYLESAGIDATGLFAEDAGIFSNALYDHASCDLDATAAALSQRLPRERVVVLPGFYGVDGDGQAHLFGRGGSDYSAGCIASCLDADVLEFWKDVSGFLTADPRRVRQAQPVAEITFDEARELGFFGAKIIHPRTFEPLRGKATAVSIRCVDAPDAPGTRIVPMAERRGRPVCLSEKTDVALFSLYGGGMAESSGVVGSVFGALKLAGVSVDVISTGVSEVSFSVSARQAPLALEALQRVQAADPSLFERITVEQGLCNVALVGQEGLSAGHLSRALAAVDAAGVQPLALSCPRSRISLSLIVSAHQSLPCLTALHRIFFESTTAPSPNVAPTLPGAASLS